MAVTGRLFLQGAPLTVVVAGVGGVLWRAVDQGVFSEGEGPAYEPWRTWRGDGERNPVRLVRAAILGARPYNSQPWLFRVADPYLREVYVGVGCAIEAPRIFPKH